jgi:hypothetical protein
MARRSPDPVDGAPHGTLTGYTGHGCGCDDCRAAWRDWHRAYLREWRAKRHAAGLTVRGTVPVRKRRGV